MLNHVSEYLIKKNTFEEINNKKSKVSKEILLVEWRGNIRSNVAQEVRRREEPSATESRHTGREV